MFYFTLDNSDDACAAPAELASVPRFAASIEQYLQNTLVRRYLICAARSHVHDFEGIVGMVAHHFIATVKATH